MQKQLGFRRNIYRSWLDATAALCAETSDERALRERLDPIVEDHVASVENRRVVTGILLNIWLHTSREHPALRAEALRLFTDSQSEKDRLWIHYGLTLLAYDFFRLTTVAMGQLTRYNEGVTPKQVKHRLIGEVGQLGGLDKAVDRIVSSLRDWGILTDVGGRFTYGPPSPLLQTSNRTIELWLLRASLTANPAEEVSFADLIRLPELFPFRFTVTVDELRQSSAFDVQRQGISWDMVRLEAVQIQSQSMGQLALL